jgi:phosphoenolpyruvate carboxylase
LFNNNTKKDVVAEIPPSVPVVPKTINAEQFLTEVLNWQQRKETACYTLRIMPEEFDGYVAEVIAEWITVQGSVELSEEVANARHLISQIRIKSYEDKRNKPKQSLDEWRSSVIQSTINEFRKYQNGTFTNETQNNRPF